MQINPWEAEQILAVAGSSQQSKTVLDYFADQVDYQIQTQLVSELMARYVEVSRQLEVRNRQLEQSDANRREAQIIAALGNWQMNLATNRLWWSDTMKELLDLPDSEDAEIERFLEIVHPEDLPLIQTVLEELYRGAEPPPCQLRLVMKNGQIKWVHIRCVVHRESEETQWVHGTIQDITAAKLIEEQLKKYNDHLEELVEEKVKVISATQLSTIYALVKLAESRDDDTGDHIGRTAAYCKLLAEKLLERGEYPHVVNAEFVETVTKASPLHDIGKVGIPDAILLKPGKLTPEEFEIMKTHVIIGHKTLASVLEQCTLNAFIQTGMDITLCHHEKWDGSGYPNGLKGEEIPLSARIMALADVYDALRSKRVYKEGFSHEKSVEIIRQDSGKHFDPLLVELFLQHHREFCRIFEQDIQLIDA
jgi:putative two-component system response regulator